MTEIIDGKKVADEIVEECKSEIIKLSRRGITKTLAVVLVGNDPASAIYVNNKKKKCEYVGIHSKTYELPEHTSQEELLSLIKRLNDDMHVDGILVQLPLPAHIDENTIITAIDPAKDVDGFHPASVGALSIGLPGYVSCTPAGIIQMLKRYNVEISGKNCVIIGRSNIVGKPMAMLMLKENATVTIAHSRTADLKGLAKTADILIVAVGKPELIDRSYVKEGAVVIDVGINRRQDKSLCGDVLFDDVAPVASAITPVPGGVGPVTIAMLMHNCVFGLE